MRLRAADALTANHARVPAERGRLDPQRRAAMLTNHGHMRRTEPQSPRCQQGSGAKADRPRNSVAAEASGQIERLKLGCMGRVSVDMLVSFQVGHADFEWKVRESMHIPAKAAKTVDWKEQPQCRVAFEQPDRARRRSSPCRKSSRCTMTLDLDGRARRSWIQNRFKKGRLDQRQHVNERGFTALFNVP